MRQALTFLIVALLLTFSLHADPLPADLTSHGFPTYGISIAVPDRASATNNPAGLTIGHWHWKNTLNAKFYEAGLRVELAGPASGDITKSAKSWADSHGFTITDRKATLGKENGLICTRAYNPDSQTLLQDRLAILVEHETNVFAFVVITDKTTNPEPILKDLSPHLAFGKRQPNHRFLDRHHDGARAFACARQVNLGNAPFTLRWFTDKPDDALLQIVNITNADSDFAVRIQVFSAKGTMEARAREYEKTLPKTVTDPLVWKPLQIPDQTPCIVSDSMDVKTPSGAMRVRWLCRELTTDKIVVFTQMIQPSAFDHAADYEKAFMQLATTAYLAPPL